MAYFDKPIQVINFYMHFDIKHQTPKIGDNHIPLLYTSFYACHILKGTKSDSSKSHVKRFKYI